MQPGDPAVQKLREIAVAASERAYCPYSRFPVGAAVLASSGVTYAGCNVENASSGLTVCAERNAVCQAIASGERAIVAVAIFTPTHSPTPPCGACLQVINEFGPDAEVFSFASGDECLRASLSELLPRAFGPGNLR